MQSGLYIQNRKNIKIFERIGRQPANFEKKISKTKLIDG